jgi:hypothetical protein
MFWWAVVALILKSVSKRTTLPGGAGFGLFLRFKLPPKTPKNTDFSVL